MKNIIAATAITLMAGTAAMADTAIATVWVDGSMEVVTSSGSEIQCHLMESEIRDLFEESGFTYYYVDLVNEHGRKVGWSYSTTLDYASAGFMLSTTCIKS